MLSSPIPLQVKKLGKKADMSEFRAQLDSIGVKIVEVTADGNCFFRFRTLFLSWILVNNFFISRKEGVLVVLLLRRPAAGGYICCLLSYMTTHRSLQGNG